MAKLFYIIGASGSGKNSLIQYARDNLPEGAPITFAHRYITRPVDTGGENHIALNTAEFNQRLNCGYFCMHWHSHYTDYGIGNEIHLWMADGLNVVVNGALEYLPQAREDFPNLIPMFIQTQPDLLKQRLQARGRESTKDIVERLAKAKAMSSNITHPRLVQINNDGELANAGNELVRSLQALV